MKRYLYSSVNFLYKWLPIFFGCHCRADRSFYYKGIKFPVCARCTGQFIGMIIAILTCWLFSPKITLLIIMMIPLIVDGCIQLFSKYESTNIRRMATGILFGYALLELFFISVIAVFKCGFNMGIQSK